MLIVTVAALRKRGHSPKAKPGRATRARIPARPETTVTEPHQAAAISIGDNRAVRAP